MATPDAVVRVDVSLLQQVRKYSLQTGVSVKRCVDEAVTTWLNTVAPARLDYMAMDTPSRQISQREIKHKLKKIRA